MRKAAIVLAVALLAGGVVPVASPQDANAGIPVIAVGVLTDNKANVAMIWVDGEDAPAKLRWRKDSTRAHSVSRPRARASSSPTACDSPMSRAMTATRYSRCREPRDR